MGKALRPWKFTCSPEQFAALRTDPAFQQLTTLAHVLNVLRFYQSAIPKKRRRTPESARQQINAFYFMAATLFEGWKLARRMGRRFRSYATWPAGFGTILADPIFQNLFDKSLTPLRNQVTFHFFEDEIGKRLMEHDPNDLVFATGRGPKSGRVYYELPDFLTLRTFVNTTVGDAELLTRAAPLLGHVGRLATAFLNAGDRLVVEGLSRMGFREERGK